MNRDYILIVDQYDRYLKSIGHNRAVNTEYEARELTRMTQILGPAGQRYALIHQADETGRRAYQQHNYHVESMDGDRPQRLRDFIKNTMQVLQTNPPRNLVVVTSDPEFEIMFGFVPPDTRLEVWAPQSSAPQGFLNAEYRFRPLESVLPEIKVPLVDTRLDFENLYINLQERGANCTPQDLIKAVKTAIDHLGEVVNIVAYADWDLLSRRGHQNPQRELARLGVETSYQVNMRGKNSADMKMADDVRTLWERDPQSAEVEKIVVIGTCDRDFRPLVDTARKVGKRLVLLTLRGAVSPQLLQAAGQDTIYLDEHLNLPRSNPALNGPKPWDQHAGLTTELVTWFEKRRQSGAPEDQVRAALANSHNGGLLQQSIADGILIFDPIAKSDTTERTYRLNRQHPLVQSIQALHNWVVGRIGYLLGERRLPWVDSNYLARGMAMDNKLIALGVGQTREEVDGWLELLASVGVIVKRVMPHPKTSEKLIATWWPQGWSGTVKSTATAQENTATGESQSPQQTVEANPSIQVQWPVQVPISQAS